jgi:hypothetical protein
MEVKEAIVAFAQSEKIKTGILWLTQSFELLPGLHEADRAGAERIIRTNLHMLLNEVRLAQTLTSGISWEPVEKPMNTAIVMVNSGVPQEAAFHLTQALSQVTNIGGRSMKLLKDEGLL